jgi:hypothetical protein
MQNYRFQEKQPLIHPKNYFYLANGQIIKYLEELPDVLEKADMSIFNSHVTPYKNDFAKWIYEVYFNIPLSQMLSEVKSREETIRILRAYMKQKNKDAAKEKEGFLLNKEENNLFRSSQEQVTINITKNPVLPNPEQQSNMASAVKPSQPANFANQSSNQAAQSAIYSQQNTQHIPPVLPQSNAQQQRKIYVWKTQDSTAWVSKSQRKIDEQKSQQATPDKILVHEKKIEKEPIQQNAEQKQEVKTTAAPIKAEATIIQKQEIKKEEIKIEQQILSSQEIKTQQSPSIVKELKLKEDENKSLSNADEFFIKNPVTMGQMIESKKSSMVLELIPKVDYLENQAPAAIIEQLKDAYSKTYQKMVYMRKSGFDTSLVEMMLFRVPSKIKIFEASKENKDAIVVKRYLNETIEELNNMKG